MISLRHKIIGVALVIATTLIIFLHLFCPPELLMIHFPATGTKITSQSTKQQHSQVPLDVDASLSHVQVAIRPLPVLRQDRFHEPFRPSSIETILNKYTKAGVSPSRSSSSLEENSVPVTQEDLDYAYANWIRPFESTADAADSICDSTAPSFFVDRCHTLVEMWNTIENFVAKRTNSNAPVVTFIDPLHHRQRKAPEQPQPFFLHQVLPKLYHAAHHNATIISISEHREDATTKHYKRIFSFSPPPPPPPSSSASSSSASSSNSLNAQNKDWIFDRDAVVSPAGALSSSSSSTSTSFGHFWISCNFVAQTFIFDTSLLFSASSTSAVSAAGRRRRLTSIFASLPMSLHVFALLPTAEVDVLEKSIADSQTGEVLHPPENEVGKSLWEGTVQKLRISVEKLAVVCPGNRCLHVVVVHVLESQRACAKTWGAPLVQWGRQLVATSTSDGILSFQVHAVSTSAKGSGRRVHPLQYIPSVNLDTLLGAGLSVVNRIRLLADMIRTPRYSDPLPHNWVVGRGGKAVRIDRVDKRYDREVDETKGYWGRSTRGYLHLLGHHLCLKIRPKSGLPAVMTVAKESSVACGTASVCDKECAAKCSYVTKGQIPCESCLQCGECLEKMISSEINSNNVSNNNGDGDDSLFENFDVAPESRTCHIEYSSMHSARKKWKEWERIDKKNGNFQ